MEPHDDKTFYTETMARLLTRQGRYDRAAEVYRYLVARYPQRRDLERALAEVVSRQPKGAEQWAAVSSLIDRWVTLLLRQRMIRHLNRISIPQSGRNRPGE